MLEQRLRAELREVFAPPGWVRLQCGDHGADLPPRGARLCLRCCQDGKVRRYWKPSVDDWDSRAGTSTLSPTADWASVSSVFSSAAVVGFPTELRRPVGDQASEHERSPQARRRRLLSPSTAPPPMERRRRACLWRAVGHSFAADASMIPSSASGSSSFSSSSARWPGTLSSPSPAPRCATAPPATCRTFRLRTIAAKMPEEAPAVTLRAALEAHLVVLCNPRRLRWD